MKKILAFGLILAPAMAGAWEYWVVESNGILISATGTPPQDMSYPAAGQPAPVLLPGEQQQGVAISERQLAASQAEPHVIVIPDKTKLTAK